ncbi:radial spoke head protein 4 homolog A-like isoform X2 [Daktulosphaira vitifoliae]|uniref:radial spoke head protein 4 homolog A-like isoform X2 n=1 Tax=Daktulosphaira vitifoliae TaxID=58002 RepID=UPI0021AA6AAB|nr:radial spoke head protein 4 homolog A-like isoform X2 [Daktulosphaira vitifoliae]
MSPIRDWVSYSHFEEVLNKILQDMPSNPVEQFENYSKMVKQTYINLDTRFERVYVDNINAADCQKNLEIYKCALKKQMKKQQNYFQSKMNKEVKCPKNTVDVLENTSSFEDKYVQNLWEANYMFRKAGYGLSNNEVSLIAILLNQMSEMNKFRSLRYWGKIFGIQKNYYIIECEWSDIELQRRLSKENLSIEEEFTKSNNNYQFGDNLNVGKYPLSISNFNDTKINDQEKLNSNNTQNQNNIQSNFINSDITIKDVLSTNTLCGDKNVIPPEISGFGNNKNVYFVTNDLNEKWIELPSVKSNHIIEAKMIKYFFTGNLNAKMDTRPIFNGYEIHYLRAQIARISASTHICPSGYYEISLDEGNNFQIPFSIVKSIPQLSKKFITNCVKNKNFEPISNLKLLQPENWVHYKSKIGKNGFTKQWTHWLMSKSFISENNSNSKKENNDNVQTEENISDYDEDYSDSESDLFENLSKDMTENKKAWKGEQCSPYLPNDSYIAMKSNIWPGAFAVAYKHQTELLYVGWGQKFDIECYTPLIEPCGSEFLDENNLIEIQDPTYYQEQEYYTYQEKLAACNLLLEQSSGDVYEEDERILKNYNYD